MLWMAVERGDYKYTVHILCIYFNSVTVFACPYVQFFVIYPDLSRFFSVLFKN